MDEYVFRHRLFRHSIPVCQEMLRLFPDCVYQSHSWHCTGESHAVRRVPSPLWQCHNHKLNGLCSAHTCLYTFLQSPLHLEGRGRRRRLLYCCRFPYQNHEDNLHLTVSGIFRHFHPFYEFCILLAPKAVHLIEGTKYNIECFDIVGIKPNVLHRTYYPQGDPCKRIIIRFNIPTHDTESLPDLKRIFSIFDTPVPIFRFSPEINKEIFEPINDIYMLGKAPSDISNFQIHLNFMEFLSLIYKHRNDNVYTNAAPENSIEGKTYSITSYIHTHYGDNLSLNFISSHFYINNYYLSHQFKEITGFTLTDYIHMTRVRNVQTMLLSTDTPITDIAIQCGFSSFSQFNRVFRKHVGISPSEYRKNGNCKAGTNMFQAQSITRRSKS